MEDRDNEEYKKRNKELIEKMERDKDIPVGEQQVIEAKERLLQTTISKIHPSYRNERIILVLTYIIRDYYMRISDPTEKEQFQEKIDALYKLIYEELKKPNLYLPTMNPYRRKTANFIEKRRILDKMIQVLGTENIKQFYVDYDVKKLFPQGSRWKNNSLTFKEKVWLTIIVSIIMIFFMLLLF